jgi:hypothetical protein
MRLNAVGEGTAGFAVWTQRADGFCAVTERLGLAGVLLPLFARDEVDFGGRRSSAGRCIEVKVGDELREIIGRSVKEI